MFFKHWNKKAKCLETEKTEKEAGTLNINRIQFDSAVSHVAMFALSAGQLNYAELGNIGDEGHKKLLARHAMKALDEAEKYCKDCIPVLMYVFNGEIDKCVDILGDEGKQYSKFLL